MILHICKSKSTCVIKKEKKIKLMKNRLCKFYLCASMLLIRRDLSMLSFYKMSFLYMNKILKGYFNSIYK